MQKISHSIALVKSNNILLAKSKKMFYPNNIIRFQSIARWIATHIIISLLIISFPVKTFANPFAQDAEENRIKGFEAQQKGNLETALKYYSKALSLGLESEVLFNDIGVLYEQLGLIGRAEEFYQRAITLNSQYLPPYTNLAYLYLSKEDKYNAITYFQERLKRSGEKDPWRNRIKQELYRLDPLFKVDPNTLVRTKEQEEERRQKQITEKARADFNVDLIRADQHFQRGMEYMAKKEFDNAIFEFDRALVSTPGNPKIEQARQDAIYERLIVDVKMRTKKAIQKLYLGEVDSARQEFQEILATIPNGSNQISK